MRHTFALFSTLLLAAIAALSPSSLKADTFITPVPYVVPAVVDDRQEAQVPDRVQLDANGMLGARIQANTYTRLLETVDVDRLLEGYRKRPGRQTWDGEHIGKWIHAASLAWANSGDAKLRAKISAAVAELVKCQEADGYPVTKGLSLCHGPFVMAGQPCSGASMTAAANGMRVAPFLRIVAHRVPLHSMLWLARRCQWFMKRRLAASIKG